VQRRRRLSAARPKRTVHHPNADLVPEGERPCPICGSPMDVVSHDGVSVDECRHHGVWLDYGELEKVVAKARRITRRECRAAAREAKKQGKYEGICFGWFSLLWD